MCLLIFDSGYTQNYLWFSSSSRHFSLKNHISRNLVQWHHTFAKFVITILNERFTVMGRNWENWHSKRLRMAPRSGRSAQLWTLSKESNKHFHRSIFQFLKQILKANIIKNTQRRNVDFFYNNRSHLKVSLSFFQIPRFWKKFLN